MTMNHRFTPLKPPADRDAAGQSIGGWTPLPDRWGDVLFQTGAEVMRANAAVAIKRCSIRANFDPAVDESWRARYLGVDYNIVSVQPDSKDRRKMFLVCEAVK
jgi:SPP1 family predicted phage head-tail adaptor